MGEGQPETLSHGFEVRNQKQSFPSHTRPTVPERRRRYLRAVNICFSSPHIENENLKFEHAWPWLFAAAPVSLRFYPLL
jgi:hypothetical protein